MDNCGYYCVNFILFLENYVKCKEIIWYFSLKWGGSVIKWEGGLTFNEKFIIFFFLEGGGVSLLMEMGSKKI